MVPEVVVVDAAGDSLPAETNKDASQNLFPDSPVYEPDDDVEVCVKTLKFMGIVNRVL